MARSNAARDIKFEPGRVVGGSFYNPKTKDADGKPLLVKTGQNAGKPTQQYSFGVAYAKTKAHWAHETWGADIWAVGNTCFPKIAEGPSFSWKVTDGDSKTPNKKGHAPCENEGHPGHWVVWFSSAFAPKIVNADGSAYILEKDAVMPGDFVEVHATIDGNVSTQNPGVYVNHNVVSFQGYSQLGRIQTSGVDPTSVGFGKGAKPAGLSMVPPSAGSAAPPAAAPAYVPPVGLPPALPGALPAAPGAMPAPTAVVPSPGFLAPPPAMPAPLPPPAAPVRQMTAKAQGNTYEALIAQGWNDALLVQHGMMVA